jgi:hypothetical protein
MILPFLKKYWLARTVLALTGLFSLISLLFTCAILLIFTGEITPTGIFISLTAPWLISPFAIVMFFRIIVRLEKAEQALNDKNRILEQALEEVKALSGLLPICAKCKKIRDDKGYWNQIESYIEEHSNAQFSHGLCEACLEKMYGGQKWYQKRKTDG